MLQIMLIDMLIGFLIFGLPFLLTAFKYGFNVKCLSNIIYVNYEDTQRRLTNNFDEIPSGLLIYKLPNKWFPYRIRYVDILCDTRNHLVKQYDRYCVSVIYKRPFPMFQSFNVRKTHRIIEVDEPLYFIPNGLNYSKKQFLWHFTL